MGLLLLPLGLSPTEVWALVCFLEAKHIPLRLNSHSKFDLYLENKGSEVLNFQAKMNYYRPKQASAELNQMGVLV